MVDYSNDPITKGHPINKCSVHSNIEEGLASESISGQCFLTEAAMATLTLSPLDVRITICIFLHPSDILALRKTCKALELTTRRRVIWIAALHRVCIDNALFLPSFPIPDMSDLELEQAAMGPRRWLNRCAFKKQNSNEPGAMTWPRTTRVIKQTGSYCDYIYIVPGGRYVVNATSDTLFVWDMGYVASADCKLIASVGIAAQFRYYLVQVTLDGKGLVIAVHRVSHISVFEIYPQSETPLLTQIAHVAVGNEYLGHLSPDTMIFREFCEDGIIFRVLDYRLNHSIRFSADFDVHKSQYNHSIFATRTAIMVFCPKEIIIWAIPPLSPQPSDPLDYSPDNPAHIPPLFRVPILDGILSNEEIRGWKVLSSWYFDCWEAIYFDICCRNSRFYRFKLAVKPDLSDASLHFIDTSEFTPDDFFDTLFLPCRICEGNLVSHWSNPSTGKCEAYTGLTPTSFSGCDGYEIEYRHSLCAASGRLAYVGGDDGDERIVVVDLL